MIPENTKTGPMVCACVFQREKDSPWEWGFDVNSETLCDSKGKVVERPWDIKSFAGYGCMHLPVSIKNNMD